MRKYAVHFKPSVDRQLQRLPVSTQKRIVGEVAALGENPRPAGVVKLAGTDTLWRIRVGDYRVIYEIHDTRLIVLVLRVAHRKDVYR